MNERDTSGRFYLALWVLVLVLVPFYLMGTSRVSPMLAGSGNLARLPIKVESGVPQLADYLMAALMALVFLGKDIPLLTRTVPAVGAFAMFVGYITLVNVFWGVGVLESPLPLLRSTLFYVYDFLLLLTFIILYSRYRDRLLLATLSGITGSVFVQVLLLPWSMTRGTRQTLFFNNPNQLGYFAVLAATLFFLGTRRFRVHPALQAGFYVAVALLTALSLSKAALAGLVVLMLLICLNHPRVLFAAAAIAAILLLAGGTELGLVEKLARRVEVQDSDESLAERGYDRIVHHPEYLVFGAGEGSHERFVSAHPGEIHSTFGTLLFSYGLVGAALFARAVWTAGRRAGLKVSLALAAPFLYGLTHHGLRFTLFWVVLAFLACLPSEQPDEAEAYDPLPQPDLALSS